jgi:hypothetical protein
MVGIFKARFVVLAIMVIAVIFMSTGCFQIINQDTHNAVPDSSPPAMTNFPDNIILSIQGSFAGERFGSSVVPIDDVDGAGHPGIIVGAIAASPFQKPQCGTVYVISLFDVQTRYRMSGDEAYDEFGSSLAVIGDVDNDKISDFIVGTPLGDVDGLMDAGYAGVYSGVDGKRLEYITGTANYFKLGHSVAGIGDVNMDSIPDFAVGSPYAYDGLKINIGIVILQISGNSTHGRQSLSLYGKKPGEYFGWSIAGIGDINGDQIPDIAVGAPGVRSSNGAIVEQVGQAYILSGNDGTTLYELTGTVPGECFGFSIIGTGDIDGDEVPDLAVGAPAVDLSDSTAFVSDNEKSGKAYVFSGINGRLLFELEGSPQGCAFGYSLASGDVNSDGVPDIIVGDPSAGQKHGAVHVFSGKDGTSLYVFFDNPVRKDEVGFALNCGNDLNQDGRPDVIVGAYSATNIEALPCGKVFMLDIP